MVGMSLVNLVVPISFRIRFSKQSMGNSAILWGLAMVAGTGDK
jgi:hypothetical protein